MMRAAAHLRLAVACMPAEGPWGPDGGPLTRAREARDVARLKRGNPRKRKVQHVTGREPT